MWRYTLFLRRRDMLDRAMFVEGCTHLFHRIASLPDADRPHAVALNLPFDPVPAELCRMFGDRFDAVGELLFRQLADAVRVLRRLQDDPALRVAADRLIDRAACSCWLAELVPQFETPGTRVKFVVAGQTVDGLSLVEAQGYWRDVHPGIFRAVPDFMQYITRYVQMHGSDVAALSSIDILGRYDFYPMCADMGLRTVADVEVAYALPSYHAIIRPDELRFSKVGDMISFASDTRIVLD